jgi:ankyrin repeat protein
MIDLPDALDYGLHWSARDEWLVPTHRLDVYPDLDGGKTPVELRNRNKIVADRRNSGTNLAERRAPNPAAALHARGSYGAGNALHLIEDLAQEEISRILKTKYTLDTLISEFQLGVAKTDRKHKRHVIRDCFSGADAVTWLTERLQIERKRALLIGEKIWATGRFHHDLLKKPFSDSSKVFFVFSAETRAAKEDDRTFTRQEAFDVNLLIQEKAAKEKRGATPAGLVKRMKRGSLDREKLTASPEPQQHDGPMLWESMDLKDLQDNEQKFQSLNLPRKRSKSRPLPTEFSKSGFRVGEGEASVEFDNVREQKLEELRRAVADGNLRAVKNLVEKRKTPLSDTFDRRAQTALHVACENDREVVVKYILDQLEHDKNTDVVNMIDDNGWTPLLVAANGASFACSSLLLEHGADPWIPNNQGTSPLHYLARRAPDSSVGHAVTAAVASPKQRKSSFTNLARRKSKVQTPDGVYLALLEQLVEAAKIGELPPDVHGKETPDRRLSSLINAQTSRAETPLIYATQRGNLTAAKWLLSQGADWKQQNRAGVSAAVYAEQSRVLALMGLFVDEMERAMEAEGITADHIGRQLDELEMTTIELGGEKLDVPDMLWQMSKFIRDVGLGVEGIFRISPDHMELRSVRARLELFNLDSIIGPMRLIIEHSGGLPQAPTEAEAGAAPRADAGPEKTVAELAPTAARGVHIITSLYKQVLRDLPEAIFPPSSLADVYAVAKSISDGDDEQAAIDKLRKTMAEHMSDIHRATLHLTIELLADVGIHQDLNKMGNKNLATVFGPLLFRPPQLDPTTLTNPMDAPSMMQDMLQNSALVNTATLFLIDQRKKIFGN